MLCTTKTVFFLLYLLFKIKKLHRLHKNPCSFVSQHLTVMSASVNVFIFLERLSPNMVSVQSSVFLLVCILFGLHCSIAYNEKSERLLHCGHTPTASSSSHTHVRLTANTKPEVGQDFHKGNKNL